MKNICVFLSARDLTEKYAAPARELARLLAENNYGLVYGGSEAGLMKVVADEVEIYGGRIIAISTTVFQDIVRQNVYEAVVTKDLSERKRLILGKSDAIVALPGGTGTMDEITEVIELKKLGLHKKPIVLLNVNGFWDGLVKQLKRMSKEGFLPRPLNDLIYVTSTPRGAISYIKKHL